MPAETARAYSDPIEDLRKVATRDVLTGIGEALYRWDIEAGTLDWSPDADRLMGLADGRRLATARLYATLLDPDTKQTRETVLAEARNGSNDGADVAYDIEYALAADHLQGGDKLWLEDRGCLILDETGTPVAAHGAVRIVTERRRAEDSASRAALIDSATSIPNRAALDLALARALADLSRPRSNAAKAVQSHDAPTTPEVFVMVALEDVETVNSVYGFEAGDTLILEATKRLRAAMRGDDMIARFSGAKFGLLLHDCKPQDAEVAARRFRAALESGYVETPAGPVSPDAVISAVRLTEAPKDTGRNATGELQPRSVYTAAYQALELARSNLREPIALYRDDPERTRSYREAAEVASKVNRALRNGRVRLAWQPIVDAGTHQTVFHEALIRMETEDGVWEAGRFIETAMKLNMVRRVDHYALDAAMDVLSGYEDAVFSLNISNDTAADPAWLAKLSGLIGRRPELASRLIVEITESHAAHSLKGSQHFIGALHDLGARVALDDDFGAGFTAFRNLKDLNFDIIKIDGHFAADLVSSRENQEFIQSLVRLAKISNAKTVVEWVEDFGSAETLYEWGVDYLQGFYFGKASETLPWSK